MNDGTYDEKKRDNCDSNRMGMEKRKSTKNSKKILNRIAS